MVRQPIFPYPDTCSDPCEGPAAVARATGATPASSTSHALWYGQQRHLFTDRRSIAQYAVVLDLPLFFWRGFSSVAVPGNLRHVLAMQNCTNLFDEEGITYDVLFHGHPDFYDDAKHWERLASYHTLVLPEVESISDAHVEHVKRYIADGGRVVAVCEECTGITDEEDMPREVPAFADVHDKIAWIETSTFRAFQNNNEGPERQQIIEVVEGATASILSSNFSSEVSLSMWMHGEGPMVSVQIADGSTHRTSTATNSMPHYVSMHLGSHLSRFSEHLEVLFYSYNSPSPLQLDYEIAKDAAAGNMSLSVTVPAFDWFGALAVGVRGENSVRAAAGRVRKYTERTKLAFRVTPGADADPYVAFVLSHAEAVLQTVQGRNASPIDFRLAPSLLEKLTAAEALLATSLKRVQEQSVAFNRAGRMAAINNTGAVASFNFDGSTSTGSRSSDGWTKIEPNTLSSSPHSAGWVVSEAGQRSLGSLIGSSPAPAALAQGKKVVDSLNCPFSDQADSALLCTYLFSNSTALATLNIPVPRPGNYTVEVVMGEPSAMVTRVALTNVWGDSAASKTKKTLVAAGQRLPVPGEFATIAFRVAVLPPLSALRLSFGGMAVSPFFQFDDRSNGTSFYTMGWMINALIVRDAAAHAPQHQLSAAAAASLRDHDRMASGIRSWNVLGPLDDSDGTCLTLRTDAEINLNTSARYPKKGGGETSWKQVELDVGDNPLAYLDFEQHAGIRDEDGLGATALALTYVKLPGNRTKRVRFRGSTAGVGVAYVGPAELFRDELNVGLLANEEAVHATLVPGWNVIMIRACTKWGAQGWGVWLEVENSDGHTKLQFSARDF